MTVIYIITTVGHGKGGHFHSLNTIANTVGQSENVHVINIGVKQSEVLNGLNYNCNFIDFNGYNFLTTLIKLKKLVKQLNPDAIHAFDLESFAFSRLLSRKRKQTSILNKCGGPNPKKYFPKVDELVLFSKENNTYFNNKERYKKTKISLIPNRVKPVFCDISRVDSFNEKYGVNDITLLRISRIGKHYHKSITQSINLLAWLLNKGVEARLVIIGTIQDDDIFNSILNDIKLKNLHSNVIVETSNQFTHNASEVLDIADFIIGTGRNFMEASSLNKVLLVPYKDSEYPLLVSNDNFDAIFSTNFSPRTKIEDYNERLNLESIHTIVQSKKEIESKKWFDSHFNIENGITSYKSIYLRSNQKRKSQIIDAVINILYSIKTFVLK